MADGKVMFVAQIGWHASMYVGAKLHATAPHVGTVAFVVPEEKKAFSVQVPVPGTVTAPSFALLPRILLDVTMGLKRE